jgi:outer membrane protein assembly factor BamB
MVVGWAVVMILLSGFFPGRALAADWPMFHGNPALTGVAAGSLPGQPGKLWSYKTAGPIHSSAAVVGGVVYVGSDAGQMLALSLDQGKRLWEFNTTNGPVESSPLVAGGRVFFGTEEGLLNALDAASGRRLWSRTNEGKIVGGPNIARLTNGEIDLVLYGGFDNRVHCVDAATGKSNWVFDAGSPVNSSVAVAGDRVVFGTCDGRIRMLSLADGRVLGDVEIGGPVPTSPAVAGPMAYVAPMQGAFCCVDLVQGTNAWTYSRRGSGYFATPAVASEVVVFGGRDRRLHCAGALSGRPLWTAPVRGNVDSSPVICGDKVVFGSDDGRLYLVSLKTGAEIWSVDLASPVKASPAVVDGRIVIGTEDGTVFCFGR